MSIESDIAAIASGANRLAIRRDDLVVFEMTGRDRVRYLHNRCTQDIKAMTPGDGARAMILTPNGKIEGIFTALLTEESILLIADNSSGESDFLSALLRFKVADDVTLNRLPLSCVSVLGHAGEHAVVFPFKSEGDARSFPENKLSTLHVAMRSEAAPGGASWAEARVFDALSILLLEPRFGREVSDRTSAPDLPLERLVSFKKGCYAGQEVVEMATARGRPNKELALLKINGSAEIGGDVSEPANGGRIGNIASVFEFSALGISFALAYLKYGFDRSQSLRVSGSEAHAVTSSEALSEISS